MTEPESANLATDLARRAAEVPDRRGLGFEDGRWWTYRDWNEAAIAYGAALRDLGIGPGSRVALFCQNSPELVFLLFGCWRIGAVPVAISSLYNVRELQGCLDKTEPALLVADGPRAEMARQSTADVVVLGSTLPTEVLDLGAGRDGRSEALVDVPDDNESAILFTGGTTGEPKAVTVTAGGVRAALATLSRASKGGRPGPYDAAPEAVTPNLLVWPLFHSGGQQALLFALHVGRSILLLERFRPASVAAMVAEHRIDNLFLLPTMVYDLLHADPPVRLEPVRSVLIAGQAIDPTLKRDFEEQFRIPILSNYGSTEIGHVAGWTAKDVREGNWVPGTAGRVYDGVQIEMRDGDGAVLGVGEVGTIWVRSTLAKGYVGGGDEALVTDGWVNSGDVGRVDDEGVLTLVGRERDLIKCAGFQVWPAEIERELRTHPFVNDVAVVGVPDERRGEIPKAFVVLSDAPGATAPGLADELIELSRSRLAHFKQIRAVEFIDALPRSDAGKIQRGALVATSNPQEDP